MWNPWDLKIHCNLLVIYNTLNNFPVMQPEFYIIMVISYFEEKAMSLLVFNTFLCRHFVTISSCLMSLFKGQ